MKKLIFGSSMFVSGMISSSIVISSDKYPMNFEMFAAILILIAVIGFIVMSIEIIGMERIKKLFESDYDIDGRPKSRDRV